MPATRALSIIEARPQPDERRDDRNATERREAQATADTSTRRMSSSASAQLMIAFLIIVLLVALALENSRRATVAYLYGPRYS